VLGDSTSTASSGAPGQVPVGQPAPAGDRHVRLEDRVVRQYDIERRDEHLKLRRPGVVKRHQ